MIALVLVAMLGGRALAVWEEGDFITHSQGSWGDQSVGVMLISNYGSVYASTSGLIELGIPDPDGYSMMFTNGTDINSYLPAFGPIGPLTADLVNPSISPAGVFGGEVVALRLNIDFSDAGVTMGNLGIPYGDLQIHDLATLGSLNGMTVRQIFGIVNAHLGGDATQLYTIPELNPITFELNVAFAGGTNVQQWAQDHLRLPSFVDGDFVTHTQASWGDAPSGGNAAALLANNYTAVYAGTGGVFEVGTPGLFGNSMRFVGFLGAQPLLDYLPASGPDGPLGADYVNPLSTQAGGFGGEMAALKLNIDFADANLLGGVGIAFGDLEFFDLAPILQGSYNFNFNGFTVRDFYGVASGWLGFDGDFGLIPHFNALAEQLNAAFAAGDVSEWALDHLRAVETIGDFNQDGAIDAADYVMWRNGAGIAPTPLNYRRWRTNFGQVNASGGSAGASPSQAAVPEPGALRMMIFAIVGLACGRRRGRTESYPG